MARMFVFFGKNFISMIIFSTSGFRNSTILCEMFLICFHQRYDDIDFICIAALKRAINSHVCIHCLWTKVQNPQKN